MTIIPNPNRNPNCNPNRSPNRNRNPNPNTLSRRLSALVSALTPRSPLSELEASLRLLALRAEFVKLLYAACAPRVPSATRNASLTAARAILSTAASIVKRQVGLG